MSKQYDGIDIFKFIAAILIILLHTIETDNQYWQGIQYVGTRFAVPFFFIASGFLFSKKMYQVGYTKEYIKRLLFLFVLWGVCIYGPILCFDYFAQYKGRNTALILALIFRRMFVIGAAQYWYFVSLIISVLILKAISSLPNSERWSFILMIGCFGLSIYYSCTDSGLFGRVISCLYSGSNNFLLTGLPFVTLGILIEKKEEYFCKKNNYALAFCGATVLCAGEYYLNYRYGIRISISYIFQGLFVFLSVFAIDIKTKHAKRFRECSTVIYLTHWILLYNVLNPVMRKIGMNPYNPHYIVYKVALVTCLCLVLYLLVFSCGSKYVKRCFGI